MFTKSPEIDFSKIGLITDVPAHKLPPGAWSDSLNIRAKDNSVQGVLSFSDDVVLHDTDSVISGGNVVAITQYTPAGTDYLVIAYIVDGTDGFCHVVTYNTSTTDYNDITNAVSDQKFKYDSKYKPQIFVFNEILVVNPAFDAPPQFTDAGVSAGSLQEITNWSALDDSNAQPIIARVLRPFNNRLVAMNIFEEHLGGTQDDVNLPVDFVWSSTVTSIASLANVTWVASSVNTAGDAFLTQSAGKILDGLQLGPYFICYKEDAVVQVRETGDDFILAFETLFEDDGLYTSGCVQSIGSSQHIVWGNYGIYVHDGQTQKADIAKGIIQEGLFNDVKGSDKTKSFVFKQTRDKEVWFCYSDTDNSTNNGCNKAFVFDYETKMWHKRDIPQLLSLVETELDGSIKIYGGSEVDSKIQLLNNSTYTPDGYFIQQENNIGTIQYKQMSRFYPSSEKSVLIAVYNK